MVRFVDRNDVFETISVQVCHNQAVASAYIDARHGRIVDPVLFPADERAIVCPGTGQGVSNQRLGSGRKNDQSQQPGDHYVEYWN
jgi:hypothetical protein